MAEEDRKTFDTWVIVWVCIAALIFFVVLLKKDETSHLESAAVQALQQETFSKIEKRHTQNITTAEQHGMNYNMEIQKEKPIKPIFLLILFGGPATIVLLIRESWTTTKGMFSKTCMYTGAFLLIYEFFIFVSEARIF